MLLPFHQSLIINAPTRAPKWFCDRLRNRRQRRRRGQCRYRQLLPHFCWADGPYSAHVIPLFIPINLPVIHLLHRYCSSGRRQPNPRFRRLPLLLHVLHDPEERRRLPQVRQRRLPHTWPPRLR
ncbi:unnamed protein product, partial [Musa hybrid cultivar]